MNYEDEQLDRAFAGVTCLQVARYFGLSLQVGVQKSPFREDKNGKSFSLVPPDGKFFKDHATDEGGGVWPFVKLCAEHAGRVMTGKEIRDLLVELNGETPEKLTRGMVKRQVAVKRKELYANAQQAAYDLPVFGRTEIPGPWSVPVRERWDAGIDALVEKAAVQAETRGWDERVICDLIDLGLTSAPVLPWGRGRGWAWLVEKPVFKMGQLALVPVGYHERYSIFQSLENGERSEERRWVYVPYIAQKVSSNFQKHLQKMNTKVPAYPFVLRPENMEPPRVVVILEGQFDAVSFAEAFGWLQNGLPDGVYVMGLRGVQSQKALLAGYGMWLRKHKPFVWIIGDNDKAGRAIDRQKDVNAIAAEPTFVDRLRAQGCTVHAELIGHPGCKDFNDVWKAARPSIETMRAWANGVGAPDVF